MKFYINKNSFHFYIVKNKISCVFLNISGIHTVSFCENGNYHNLKNSASYITNTYKGFYLNNKLYGNETDFTKESWRRFVKMQVFL